MMHELTKICTFQGSHQGEHIVHVITHHPVIHLVYEITYEVLYSQNNHEVYLAQSGDILKCPSI